MADSMAATPRPPELRPLGVGEILDASIKVFLRNAVELFKAVAVVVVPVQLLAIVVLLSAVPESLLTGGGFSVEPSAADPFGGLSGPEVGAFVGAVVVTTLAGGLATVLATGACFKGVSDSYLGAPVRWRESLRFAFRRLGPLVWVTILATVRNQRLGDLAAETLVVRVRRAADQAAAPPSASSATEAPQDWDMSGVGEPELVAVRRFLERRVALEPSARVRLAADLASRIRPRVLGAPPGQGDEAFLEALLAAKRARR